MSGDGIRVLLVDDQDLVRAGFRTILETQPGIHVVAEAADGEGAVGEAARTRPDVICMDVQMPGVDGLEATRRITADPAIAAGILMLTTFDREDYLFAALEAGASGFLLKNSSPEALIEAVRVIARGDALLAPEVTRRVIERAAVGPAADAGDGRAANGRARDAADAGEPAAEPPRDPALTGRESEVLACLARGMSNAEIAAELHLGEATVKTHVSSILGKLGIRDRVHAVVYAFEHGLVRPASR